MQAHAASFSEELEMELNIRQTALLTFKERR